MFAVSVVVFREVLEAALLLGVVAAASRGIAGRMQVLATGVAAGVGGALLVALSAESISRAAQGMGQELFNASVLGLAVAMLAWHSIWMARHGVQMAAAARDRVREVREGRRGLAAIGIIAAVAVVREGSETVLFLYGMQSGGGLTAASVLGGGALGVGAGAALGFALYAGLVRIPVRWFFSVTGALLLLLAAGMAGQMARFLVQADVLPGLVDPIWDTSQVVSGGGAAGSLLQVLMGYDPRPSAMQMLFFAATLAIILAGARLVSPPRPR